MMFWFNRMTEHWTLPQRLDVAEHVRRGKLQVVQAGTFGPQFFGLADDPEVDRQWAGMPLQGVGANLEYVEELIPRLQEAGARVIGQMSMSWHYGDHEDGKGLFGVWDRIWEEELGGTPPCKDAALAQQRVEGGDLRRWPIQDRPYQTYSGCMCNPHWVAMLKAMLKRAIEAGVDGMNVHHNFERPCACGYCHEYVSGWLSGRFADGELRTLFGTADLTGVEAMTARDEAPAGLKQRLALEMERVAQYRRKEAFDEIFIEYGRSLKPGLLLGQWYHKYDFKPGDERSLLPTDLWARDEDFIWYSQGGAKGFSSLHQGYLADMGLPARFIHAAGGGRPYIINKYDFRRWRLSIAEASANHAAGPAVHWSESADASFPLEDYCGPVYRYQRFLADHEALIHPARPWSQIGLVYPRRGEVAGEGNCTDVLRRVGRLLEDAHCAFDMVIDHQLEERASDYEMLILPEVARLSDREIGVLDAFAGTGKLICTGASGTLTEGGAGRTGRRLAQQKMAVWIDEVPCDLGIVEIWPGTEVPVYPTLAGDPFGQGFMQQVGDLLGGHWVETDAPWYVRMRAWLPGGEDALVLHWVNYHQDEDSEVEVPWPEGPIAVQCAVPAGQTVEAVDWLYPEMGEPLSLDFFELEGRVEFTIPQLIVYGMSVLRLKGC